MRRLPTGLTSEQLGRRIAERRAKLGWTQAELAERVAISRVALSHLEAGKSAPGERTVALLAGVFGIEPHELVDGTSYPIGKAERLPLVTARHTEAELQLALLDRDLEWIDELAPDRRLVEARLDDAIARLTLLLEETHDLRQRRLVHDAIARARAARP